MSEKLKIMLQWTEIHGLASGRLSGTDPTLVSRLSTRNSTKEGIRPDGSVRSALIHFKSLIQLEPLFL